MEPRARIGRNLDTSKCSPSLNKLVGYKHQEDAVGGGGSKQWQTNTQTVSPVIHKLDGASGNDRKHT